MKNKNTSLIQTTLAVQVGKSDVFEFSPKANGVNIRVNSTGKTFFVPTANVNEVSGALSTAASLIPALYPQTETVPTKRTKKRKRRTKAEIEAARNTSQTEVTQSETSQSVAIA